MKPPEIACERLVKLLGMLGSAHPGERAAAGLQADKFVRNSASRGATLFRHRPSPRPIRARPSTSTTFLGKTRSGFVSRAVTSCAIAIAISSSHSTNGAHKPTAKQLAWLRDMRVTS